jgi:hypothetical protein
MPRLDRGVWEWLEADRPDSPPGGISTRWDIFVLESIPVQKWRCEDTDKTGVYWDLVEQAVKAGMIDVADGVEHNFFDKPLIDEPEWQKNLVQQKRRVHANAKLQAPEAS